MENQISSLDHHGGSPQNNHPSLVAPNDDLLSVLKTVGAKGSWTPAGKELFSIRQLFEFLIAYIKKNLLFDPMNPLIVYCRSDPLGKVFGVEQFTKHDALSLLMSNCVEVFSSPKVHHKVGVVPLSVQSLFVSSPGSHVTCHAPIITTSTAAAHFTSPRSLSPSHHSLKRHASPPPGFTQAKRLKFDDASNSSPSAGSGEGRRMRTRQSSLSIMYSDGDTTGNGDYDWRLTFTALRVADTDTESVYSVQSKETALARDSSDDYWFVEDNDEDDQDNLDGISVQMGNEGISLEFNGEEYEVVSEPSGSEYDTDGSESPQEEIYVVYQSDEEFWADSESSDTECEDMSGDEEITDGDKWTCNTCGELNYPLRRHCDRCWALRSSWLPSRNTQNTKHRQKKETEKSSPCLDLDMHNKPHTAGSLQVPTNAAGPLPEIAEAAGSIPEIAKAAGSIPKIAKAAGSLPEIAKAAGSLPEIAKAAGSLPEIAKAAGSTPEAVPLPEIAKSAGSLPKVAGSLPEIMKAAGSIRADVDTNNRLTLDSDQADSPQLARSDTVNIADISMNSFPKQTPPESRYMLSNNDSGLGTSIHSVSTPSYPELDSGISSQEMPKDRDTFHLNTKNNQQSAMDDSSHELSAEASASRQSALQPSKSTISSIKHSPRKDVQRLKGKSSKRRQRVSFSSSSDEKADPPSPKAELTDQATKDLCMICLSKPKEASIIHGKTGHQVCCYVCAKRLKKKGKSCPVCRRPITKVIKNFMV